MSKILIVEDEEAIADLERDYLELSGFEVEVANDGESGLKRALENEKRGCLNAKVYHQTCADRICDTVCISQRYIFSDEGNAGITIFPGEV